MKQEFVELDGSHLEGGGQILRTALSLSAILQKPFLIRNIRKNRKNPGLQAQHLTCVNAMAKICNANVKGAELESVELEFIPSKVNAGDYVFDVAHVKSSAGSVTLILQTILLPLALASGNSSVVLKGGTHVPFSPPFEFIEKVYLPLLKKMGLNCSVELKKPGFYPKGDGEILLKVEPVRQLNGVDLSARGDLIRIDGISATANLPLEIAKRQKLAMLNFLAGKSFQAEIVDVRWESASPGTIAFVCAEYSQTVAAFSTLGELKKKAEDVGRESVENFLAFNNSAATIDEHLQDQILLPSALANGETVFVVEKKTGHFETNLHTIKKFLPKLRVIEQASTYGKKHAIAIRIDWRLVFTSV